MRLEELPRRAADRSFVAGGDQQLELRALRRTRAGIDATPTFVE
ncbi:MAG: hypothetical protein QM831_22545 [Kofleriaceae bacterium]